MSEYAWDGRHGTWTRSDGGSYRRAILSADLSALRSPEPLDTHTPVSSHTRSRALDKAIEEAVLAGSTLLQRSEDTAILSQKKPVQHWWHIMLSVLTIGVWLTPYLIITVARGDIRYRLDVDDWGHVWPRMN